MTTSNNNIVVVPPPPPPSPPSVAVAVLPSHVTGILDCIRHEIQQLHEQQVLLLQEQNGHTATDDEVMLTIEDALDDGFLCIDIQVLRTKLHIWKTKLFVPNINNNNDDNNDNAMRMITPYFAVKCHSDPTVVRVLTEDNGNDDNNGTSSSSSSLLVTAASCGLDCASMFELQLAQELPNFHATPIVYANPQRAEAELRDALKLWANNNNNHTTTTTTNDTNNNNIINNNNNTSQRRPFRLTVDGVEEIYKIRTALKEYYNAQQQHHDDDDDDANTTTILDIELVIRILVPDEGSQVPLGEKFGTALEDIPKLVQAAAATATFMDDDDNNHNNKIQLPIIGISFHCGSGCHDPGTYQEALKLAKQAMEIVNDENEKLYHNSNNDSKLLPSPPQRCWLLDIGGGFPGWDGMGGDDNRFSGAAVTTTTTPNTTTTTTKETTAEIAIAIRDQIRHDFQNKGITVIAEPGRYFVEAAACLASRIYKKDIIEIPVVTTTDLRKDEEHPNNSHDGGRMTTTTTTIREYKIAHGVHGVFKDALLCGESFVPMPLRDPTIPIKMTNNGKQQQESGNDGRHDNNNDNNNNDNDDDDDPLLSLVYPSRIRGPMGDYHNGQDVVCDRCELPDLNVGDWLVFDRMGAYTISIASRTGQPVVRYVQGKGRPTII